MSFFVCYFNAYFSLYFLLLSVYFICILDYGNNVRQKVNSSDFLTQV